MRRAIVKFNETGTCEIDVGKVMKYWNMLCRIYRDTFTGTENYVLAQFTPKGKRKFKIQISKEDAEQIINGLQLHEITNKLFKNCKTYLTY